METGLKPIEHSIGVRRRDQLSVKHGQPRYRTGADLSAKAVLVDVHSE
jgi:hypothetical protein